MNQPTPKQRAAVQKMIANPGMSVGAAMREVGYAKDSARNPQILTESHGFKMLMEKAGLTPDLIVKSLVDDIHAKPKSRVGELRLGADLLGLTKRESPITAVQINIGDDRQNYA